MSSSQASKKKSESLTQLADGTKIREYEVEEVHPDGSRTVTTTTIKTYRKPKVLQDGTRVVEKVVTTTTTKKRCRKVERGLLVMQAAADAVGGLVDLITGGATKCGPGTHNAPLGTRGGEEETYGDDTRDDGARDTGTTPKRREGDVSTLGAWTIDSARLLRSRASADSDRAPPPQEVNARNNHRREKRERRRGDSNSKDHEASKATPQPREQQKKRVQQQRATPQPHEQQQQQLSFFPRTHPDARSGNNGHDPGYNRPYANAKHRNINGYVEDDGGSPGTDASFMLYESDRCDQLPTFHKVVPPQGGGLSSNGGRTVKRDRKGRSFLRSMTPLRTYSSTSNPRDVNKNIRLGIASGARGRPARRHGKGRTTSQDVKDREHPSALDPEVANAIDLIRQRSKSPVNVNGRRARRGEARAQEQEQQQQQQQLEVMELPPMPMQHLSHC